MPALQVRDFPEETYQRLKTYAASQHRSIAQQTIVAVSRMLDEADAAERSDFTIVSDRRKAETAEERIARRRALFAEINALPSINTTAEEMVASLNEDREERFMRIAESCGLPYVEKSQVG